MSFEIAWALVLLTGTVALLATGRFRVDVIALLVLVVVALTGLAPVDRVLAGFSNPAVLALAGMYILSAGLSRAGVADWMGRRILGWAGSGELRLILAVTLVSGILSGFMNNVGVAAMMLPVVLALSKRTGTAPSRLLLPMVIGAQLGGFTTLIGTSANLLASDALREAGHDPIGLFGFTPVGGPILGAGVLLVLVLAPRLLPHRTPPTGGVERPALRQEAGLGQRFFRLRIPSGSLLDGRSLGESLIGPALGVHVLSVEGARGRRLAPGPAVLLGSGDELLVQGRPDEFLRLRGRRHLASDGSDLQPDWLEAGGATLARARIPAGSAMEGRTPTELGLREREQVLVLSLVRDEVTWRTHLQDTTLAAGDVLLLRGQPERLRALEAAGTVADLEPLGAQDAVRDFGLEDRLWSLRVTDDSALAGRRLSDTRLGDALGLLVLAIRREGEPVLLPAPATVLRPGDHLLVKTSPEDLAVLRGLQRLKVETDVTVDPARLESPEAGFADALVAPGSSLIGRTLRQAGFRRRFGLHVVAVLRDGGVIREGLRDLKLRLGDALLLHGPRRNARLLVEEADLILIHDPQPVPADPRRAPLALGSVGLALVPVVLGWIPVAVGVLAGAILLVLTRCLTADEAYRAVEWPVVVLVAGMLALGVALDETGTGAWLGTLLLAFTEPGGPWLVLLALTTLGAVSSQLLPGPAVVVLLAPVALAGAAQLGVAPQPLLLALAISATSLASPVSQPAHALVRVPGGYGAADFARLGLPLTILVILMVTLLAPLAHPF
ncbi:MAG: hypothetical protein EA352_08225 [Gemmatimonadales bacterium]|nr:MAG: hypothetical protein EA352_08225 [Gemmatimonadales bacterium]